MKTNKQYTPWIANDNLTPDGRFAGSFAIWTNEHTPRYIADVPLANHARLIAAAPELFAALSALVADADLGEVDLDDDERAKLNHARAVLAKVAA